MVCVMRPQEKYGFKARVYHARDFEDVAAYKKVHGSDLFIRDVEEYDRICKVHNSPWQRHDCDTSNMLPA